MAHLIDKDALVAEIEEIRKHYIERDDFDNGWNFALNKILSSLDTLEVKEVDIENTAITEWNDYIKKIDGEHDYAYMLIKREDYIVLAKHFFEFGLNASNPLTWEDIEKVCLIAREVHQFRGFWSESVYQEVLNRFKAQKGEKYVK